MQYPIEGGNIALIFLGILLVLSGPFIVYKTVTGVKERLKTDPEGKVHWFSNGLNFVIAILFFVAGILFILNNLRGNPLSVS